MRLTIVYIIPSTNHWSNEKLHTIVKGSDGGVVAGLLREHIVGRIGGSCLRMRVAQLVCILECLVLRQVKQSESPGSNLAGHSKSPHHLHHHHHINMTAP
jgi:hypothetical protein